MKNIARNLVLLGCAGSSAVAAPFLAIGDNAELFVTGQALASYNDNILLAPSSSKEEDVVFTFRPGFELQFGKDSLLKGSLVGTSTLTAYSDNSDLNNQLFGIGASGAYDNGVLRLTSTVSFDELDQPTIDVTGGTLVERDVTVAKINGEIALSEKISAGGGFSFVNTDYHTTGYEDSKSYTVPVNVYYELTPKVDVSAGVRYTHSKIEGPGGDRFDDFYYNVGARGEFTPKLTGNFSVGYTTRNADVGPDPDGTIGADASLGYAYTDKTQLSLSVSRNFTNASTGASYENTQVTIGAVSAIAVDWSVNAALTYRILDFDTGTKEDFYEATIGTNYIINNHLSAGLAYTYRQKDSDIGSAAEFKNNVVTLSLSARY